MSCRRNEVQSSECEYLLETNARVLRLAHRRLRTYSDCDVVPISKHRDDLFNDLVGYCENIYWQIEAQCFRGLKIDHKFNLGGLHHWQISGLLAL